MGDLDKNIHRREEASPYEKIVVNPIEKERRGKEKNYASLKNSSKSQIFATLISYFKRALSTFSSKGNQAARLYDQKQLLESALAFRQALVTLAREDQSHNPNFTQKLVQLWHNLVDHCNSVSLPSGTSSEILNKVKSFIHTIQHFPPGADHTLGYYFTEYAGKDWIPFPFMDLLKNLHEEYKASPLLSPLQNWIQLLNDILKNE